MAKIIGLAFEKSQPLFQPCRNVFLGESKEACYSYEVSCSSREKEKKENGKAEERGRRPLLLLFYVIKARPSKTKVN